MEKRGSSDLQILATALRFLSIDVIEKAHSGHPGMPLGMADVVTVLCRDFLKFFPQDPRWPDRDRLIFSSGHGSALLYSLLYFLGYAHPTLQDLKNFRQIHAKTAGHPEYGTLEGIEMTTGPLGQGLAAAVGLCAAATQHCALASANLHKTYVLVGDGDLMEGISYEAISLAGHLRLGSLIVLFDDNNITVDGPTHLSRTSDITAYFVAENWHVRTVDGHTYTEIYDGICEALSDPRPSLIRCRTEIGHGSPTFAGTAHIHGTPIGAEERCRMQKALNWPYAPFDIPKDILKAWRSMRQRNEKSYNLGNTIRSSCHSRKTCSVPSIVFDALEKLKEEAFHTPIPCATRMNSHRVLESIVPLCPALIGGSADLTPSTNTKISGIVPFMAETPHGRYLHYGVREHGMAAFMNGLALYGNTIPYGGTFLAFSDYMRPALRLSAMMKLHVIYLFTHDSIGLGEDGPTHQPIEHLMSLRLIPNLFVFRPADAIETYECWECALKCCDNPSALLLTRQHVPLVRSKTKWNANYAALGGYILEEDTPERQFTLLATGSEVSIAVQAKKLLNAQGFQGAVVSLPCWELFEQQDSGYKQKVLGFTSVRVSIEAGSTFGWEKYIGKKGQAFGVDRFGSSGKAEDLFQFFGLTPEAVQTKVIEMIKKKGNDK
ncbi:MAG: transketolase [Holosporales bacterium]|nr:transketolase [Holosporales bacterium]